MSSLIQLDEPLVVEVQGGDAAQVVHNLTTNDIRRLAVGQAVETFVTDVRGWVVAHGMVFRLAEDRWWLIGQHPDSARVCGHIERYIIREKAQVLDHSPHAWLAVADQPLAAPTDDVSMAAEIAMPALGASARWRIAVAAAPGAIPQALATSPVWETQRITTFWPRMGRDIWDKCIPQELDRTAQAISFTKGCYLGQETIARLDALGQLQKKLCLLQVQTAEIAEQSPVMSPQQQVVGHVTSAVGRGDYGLALAVIRRGFFQIGAQLRCGDATAQVIAPSIGG